MIEVTLGEVTFGVVPMASDGGKTGKQISFLHEKSDTVYLIPMAQAAADILVEHLSMDNEELDRRLEQNSLEAEAELSVDD